MYTLHEDMDKIRLINQQVYEHIQKGFITKNEVKKILGIPPKKHFSRKNRYLYTPKALKELRDKNVFIKLPS